MIKNLGKYAHPPKGSEPAGNKPTTGARAQNTPRNPMTNAANQSLQAQSQISAPPAPFKNPNGILNTPAPNVGLRTSATGASAPKNPGVGPVGNGKPKTNSLQLGYGNAPKIRGRINKSAKKGGHSLLYGD